MSVRNIPEIAVIGFSRILRTVADQVGGHRLLICGVKIGRGEEKDSIMEILVELVDSSGASSVVRVRERDFVVIGEGMESWVSYLLAAARKECDEVAGHLALSEQERWERESLMQAGVTRAEKDALCTVTRPKDSWFWWWRGWGRNR